MSLGARIRRALRPRQTARHDRWDAYLREVEPALSAVPRLHRFAQVPVLGDPATAAEPVAVWIEGDGEGDAVPCHAAGAGGLERRARRRCWTARSSRPWPRPGPSVCCCCAPETCWRRWRWSASARRGAGARRRRDHLRRGRARRAPAGATRRASARRPPRTGGWPATTAASSLLVAPRRGARRLSAELSGGRAWRHELALRLAGPAAQRAAHVPMLLLASRRRRTGAGAAGARGRSQRIAAAGAPAPASSASGDVRSGPSRGVRRAERRGDRLPARPARAARSAASTRCSADRLRAAVADAGRQRLARDRDARAAGPLRARPAGAGAARPAAVQLRRAQQRRRRASSDADVLVFLNNDTEIVDPRVG